MCFLAGTLVRAGAERQLVYMAASLKDLGLCPRVLCLTQGEPFENDILDLGIQVTYVGVDPSRARRLWRIVEELKSNPSTILQSAHFYTNIYVGLASRALGIPSIGAVRNDLVNEVRYNGVFGWLDLFLPHHLVTNSRVARDRAIRYGRSRDRVHLVQNALDPTRFAQTAESNTASRSTQVRLLSAGRLVRQKRVDRFLRAIGELRRQSPQLDVKARIAGDGPERPALEDLRSDLGLTPDDVTFVGESDDMPSLYGWADILVLCSENEGTPNVVLEALMSGLPVVATAVGGVPDLVSQGGGLLVRPGDDQALVAATLRLATDVGLRRRLAAEGQRYVTANHSLQRLGQNLVSVYQQVLEDDR